MYLSLRVLDISFYLTSKLYQLP